MKQKMEQIPLRIQIFSENVVGLTSERNKDANNIVLVFHLSAVCNYIATMNLNKIFIFMIYLPSNKCDE